MAKQSFKEILETSEVPVLVDFYADWCGPCKAMAPVLKAFAAKNQGKVRILKVDVDKNPRAAQQYQIQGVPTFMFFNKGELSWRQAGMVDAGKLQALLEQL